MQVPVKHIEDVAHPVCVVDVCITHGNEALMFKRSDTKKIFPGWLAFPGGHIDEGEDPLTAAIREVQEEAGVTLTPEYIQLKFVAMHHHLDRKELFIVFGFRARIPKKPDRIISGAEGYASWIDTAKLAGMDTVFPPVKYYLSHLLGNTPGIVYNYSIWNDSRLVRVVSEQTDNNS